MPDSGTMPGPDSQAPADLLQLALPRSQKVVLVIDLVESVRLMSADEAGTVARWHSFVQTAQNHTIPAHRGRLVKSLGDGLMVEFEQARDAVNAAQNLHGVINLANAGLQADHQMHLRAGINTTHVFTDNNDIYGAGVNLAARIATLAGPGETVVSASVRDGLTDGLDASVEDLGECYLKHIEEPVRAYRAGVAGSAPVVVAQREYATPLQPTIAVIPFTARSNEPEHFAIGELIADGVIAQLGRTVDLKVVSRLATTALRNRAASIQEVGAQLSADFAVSGSYVASGFKLLVTFELVDTHSHEVLWVERISGEIADLLQTTSETCHTIAAACHQAVLSQAVQQAMYRPLPTLAGQSLMFAGIAGVHQAARDGFTFSGKALSAVIERHPKHADAYAWLAKWYAIGANRGLLGPESHKIAADLADRALQASPDSPFALTISGLVKGFFQQDLNGAGLCYERALSLNPNEPLAWLYTGTLRAWQGRGEEAAEAATRALELAPIGVAQYYVETLAALPFVCAGNLDKAITLLRHSLRLNATHTSSHRVLAMALVLDGQVDDARKVVNDLLRMEPKFTIVEFKRRYAGRAHPHADVLANALLQAGVPNS